jgi:hypothetical protein
MARVKLNKEAIEKQMPNFSNATLRGKTDP